MNISLNSVLFSNIYCSFFLFLYFKYKFIDKITEMTIKDAVTG